MVFTAEVGVRERQSLKAHGMQPGRAVPLGCTSGWLGLGFSRRRRNLAPGMTAFVLNMGYRIRHPPSSNLKYISVLSSLLFRMDKTPL